MLVWSLFKRPIGAPVISILFFGTPDFAVPALEALAKDPQVTVRAVITQPDKPAGRGGIVTAPPVKRVALSCGIPVFQPQSIRKEWHSLQGPIEALGPFDLGVVVAFGQILPREVLSFPRRGCLNIHASLLPRWRGAAPIQRAIEAGDSETGVCLMQMEEGLDTGPVFSRSTTPISSNDTAASMHDKLAQAGAELLMQNLADIVAGNLNALPQPHSGVTYASKISSTECQLDWQLSAHALSLKIRAFAPYPGCFTTWHNRRLKIFQAHEAQPMPSDSPNQEAGTVVRASADNLVVTTGSGLLSLDEVQLEGKKRMQIAEFLRGMQVVPGARLVSIQA